MVNTHLYLQKENYTSMRRDQNSAMAAQITINSLDLHSQYFYLLRMSQEIASRLLRTPAHMINFFIFLMSAYDGLRAQFALWFYTYMGIWFGFFV